MNRIASLSSICLVLGAAASAAGQGRPGPPEPKPPDPTRQADAKPKPEAPLNLHAWPIFESIQEGDRSELTLLGFYNSVRSPTHRKLRVSPFFSYEWDGEADATRWDLLWPLISHERKGQETSMAVRPLYWAHDDPAQERGYNHLFPLWYSEWNKDDATLVTLPGWVYARRGNRRIVHMWPLFGRHELEGGGTRWLSLAHGVWVDTGGPAAKGSFGALPLGTYATWSPETALTVSLPILFGRYRKGDSTWWASLPFVAGRSSKTLDQVVSIPYAYTKDPVSTRHDVLFPLFTSEERHDGSRSEVSLRPFFWYDRTPERTWTLAPPFFLTYSRKGLGVLATLPYVRTERADEVRHDVLFPFITAGATKDGRSAVFSARPFFWYDRTPERTHTVAPPFFYAYDSKDEQRLWTIPYAYTKDAESSRHDVLFPLFTSKERHDGSRSEVSLRPFFWYDRTPERTHTVAAPLFYRYSDVKGNERFWSLPYLYNKNAERTRHDVLFPLFTSQEQHDGSRSEVSLRPFFWYDQTPERTHTVAPPFFYAYESKDEQRLWTIPYAYTKDAQSSRHDVLFPLFTSEEQHDGSRSEVSLRPFFWYDRTPERTHTLAAPLFYRYSDAAGTERLWSLPYLYNKDAQSTRHDVLFPLFTSEEQHDGSRSEVSLRPFFWYDETPERTWTVAPPFFLTHSSKDLGVLWTIPYVRTERADEVRHDFLFPFVTAGESKDGGSAFFTARPFFWYDRTPERTHTVAAPLFYRYSDVKGTERFWSLPYLYNKNAKRTRHDVLFPLFTSEEQHDGSRSEVSLRPFFWYDRTPERTWTFAPPFFHTYAAQDTERFWTIPYAYTRDRERTRHDVLFPLFSATESADGERSSVSLRPFFWYDRTPERTWTVAPPFFLTYSGEDLGVLLTLPYSRVERAEEVRHDVLFPLITAGETKDGGSAFFSVRPLFWYDRTPERTHTVAAPLFYSYSDAAGTERFWSLPYLYNKNAERTRHDVLFPLFTSETQHDGSRSEVSLRPFFWYDQTPERTWTLAPPFFHTYAAKDEERVWTIPYAYTREGEEVRHDVLFPLFTAGGTRDGSSSYVSARPLFWYDKTPERTWSFAFPLFHTYDAPDEQRVWTIPYAYTRTKDTTRHDVLFPLLTVESSDDGQRSQFSLRPLVWHDETPERSFTLLLPLFWRHHSKRFQSIVTPLYMSRVDRWNEKRQRVIFPLYWESTQRGRTSRVLLPLYWDVGGEEERTIQLWPFFGWSRDGDYEEYSTLWPLAAWGSGGGRGHSRFLPLWWYGREAERWHVELLWPLVHAEGDQDRAAWSVLHSLARYDSQGEDYDFRVLWWLYRLRQEGDRYDHMFLPLWWHSAEGEQENLWVLYPLFEYESNGSAGQVDVLWKLFTYDWGKDSQEWRLFYKFLHYRQEGDAGLIQVNPFFSYEWKGEEEAMLQILGGAYYRQKRQGEWRSGGLWGAF